ncbi:MAG: fused response regulator/phosphatase [Epsilonproteobacteria bacterium]|nr:fused response regulator/phosphatase [Campylobacterota bacterium]
MKSYNELSILCVEDDLDTLNIYKTIFELLFKEVYLAKDGKEGLEKFKQNHIDIIIADQNMPVMSGIEMIKEIRKEDFNIPIILLTGLDDIELLREALDLNVTAFIKKPLNKEILLSKIELISNSIIAERYLIKQQKKYIEYTNYQENLAYEKESLISKVYEDNKIKEKFEIECLYHPRDILAGDTFLVKDNYICLVDAMGKGVSAALTSTIATSFLDYIIDKKESIEEVVEEFIGFIKRFLAEGEILCCNVLEFNEDKINYAIFSMPPTLIYSKQSGVKKIISNNFGIGQKTKNFKVSSIDIKEIEKILVYSDGLNESSVNDRLYLRELREDFSIANNLDELMKIVKQKDVKIDDDLTILFLRKKDGGQTV